MITIAESNSIVALVGGVVVLQALDHSVLQILVNLFGEPEHTGGALLHEHGRDLALSGRNLEGGLILDVDLVEELNGAGSLVDEHEADVGGITGVEADGGRSIDGDGHFCENGSLAACNTDQVLRNLTAGCNAVAVNVLRLGLIEVNAALQILSAGNNDLDGCICRCIEIHGVFGRIGYLNRMSNLIANVNVQYNIVIFICTLVKSHVKLNGIQTVRSSNLGFGNVQLGDDDLTGLCINTLHCQIEIDESVYTSTNTVGVREVLSGSRAIGEIRDLTCKLVHIATPSKLLSGGGGLVVAIGITAVGVSDRPDSSLGSSDQLGAIQLVSLCKAGFLERCLCLLNGNVRISVLYDRAKSLCIIERNVLAVLQIHALVINTVCRAGNRVAAIHNVIVADAALVNAVGSPVTGMLGGVHHGEDVNCATAGYFLLNRVVTGFVVVAIVGGILRDCIHVRLLALRNDKLRIIALPDCLCCECGNCGANKHHQCQYKREHHLEILCHVTFSFLNEKYRRPGCHSHV